MLRRIAPTDVRLGMYIHGFEGSWISHPFWRSRFLLSKPGDVERVRASDVIAVIIDAARGIDHPPAAAAIGDAGRKPMAAARPTIRYNIPLHRNQPPSRRAPAIRASTNAPPPAGPCSAAEEFGRASRLVERSRRAIMRTFDEARLGKAVGTRALMPLVDQIAASVERNRAAIVSIAQLKSKHDYTYMHSIAVCTMMINLARQMKQGEEEVRQAGLAGLLHDIGKMRVPTELLDKPGPLTDEEFALVRKHPARGHALLTAGEALPAAALDVCLHHHERVDGQGYPEGLAGDGIGLHARMAAICDVYDAITSDRAYKDAWSPAEALKRMLGWDGHFDADILASFTQSIGIYPVGGLVLLRSGRLAVITGENRAAPTRPPLRAFHCTHGNSAIAPEAVSAEADEIVGLERPERWGLKGWKTMRAKLLAESVQG